MPRISLVEQKDYEFRYIITVQPRDVNYQGHLGNDSIISLVRTAQADTLRSLNFSERDLGDGKTGIITYDIVASYKAEAFAFEELVIETHIGEIRRRGFRMFHRLTKGQVIVALVEAGMATYNYDSRKMAPVPEPFLTALARHQG